LRIDGGAEDGHRPIAGVYPWAVILPLLSSPRKRGPIRRVLSLRTMSVPPSIGNGLWVPALAGTTTESLAIQRHAQPLLSSSRPISMRRISLVPAPIS
jgi:hypothetical protein